MRAGSGSSTSTPTTAGSRWRLATRGPNFCKPDVVRHDWELAKELGLNITVHVAMDRFGYTKMQITGLRDMDLLYPNTTYVHASHFTDEEWALARDSGGNVSFAPQIEVQMGHGWAPAVTALEPTTCRSACRPTWPRPRRPTSSPRCARSSARSAAASTRRPGTRTSTGSRPRPGLITARQVLGWATIGGAQVAGIADRTGSLTPGKQADIVIIDGSAVNVAPIIDPVGAVVCAADVSNVKTVMVAGEILKEDFRLKASLDAPRKAVEASRDYLVSKFGDPEPGWIVTPRPPRAWPPIRDRPRAPLRGVRGLAGGRAAPSLRKPGAARSACPDARRATGP